MKNRAVIYARYSSHNQREESIEGQLRECNDFAIKNDMIVVDNYIDRAISGKTDEREAFQKLIKDSGKGLFDSVIMYTLDRFARNRYDSAVYKARLKKNGVRIFYAKQSIPEGPEGIILESVLEGYAEYYSENLARNVKRGMKESALEAKVVGRVCIGYKKGADGQYEIEPTGAQLVKLIFNMYCSGKNINQIKEYLKDNGYRSNTNKVLSYAMIRNILMNDKYIGIYRYNDVYIENGIPTIIDKNIWDKAQSKLTHTAVTHSRSGKKENYLLTTKVFCGKCGSTLVGESGRGRAGKVYNYYKCSKRKHFNTCDKETEKKDVLENIVIKYTLDYVLTDDTIDKIADKVISILALESDNKALISSLSKSLREAKIRRDNILNAIEQGIITTATKDRLIQAENDIAEYEYRIESEKKKKPILTKDHIVYWLEKFRQGDINDFDFKQNIIDTFVNSVFVYDNGTITINYNLTDTPTRTVTKDECSSYVKFGQPI